MGKGDEIRLLTFSLQAGFRYEVTPTIVSVGFAPKMEIRPKSAGMPTLELLSKPLPYTTALVEVCDRLIATALRLPDVDGRKILQFGFISTTVALIDEMPPGIRSLIDTTLKPWGDQEAYLINIASILTDNDEFSESWRLSRLKDGRNRVGTGRRQAAPGKRRRSSGFEVGYGGGVDRDELRVHAADLDRAAA